MTPLHGLRKSAFILAGALGFAILASLLPENEYQRWQLLDDTIHANARWIYERSHFDPKPIDVVFIGPSRLGSGLNAPRLAADLAARGVDAQVVNFSLPETGRDINYLVAEQVFANKRPKLVVLGVTEKPSRYGHSAFKYIAEPSAVVAPGYFTDLNYFSNLIYLPFRQLRLFFADLMPDAFGLSKSFDPGKYRGSSIDTTGNIVLPDGRIKDGETPGSAAELDRGVRKLEASMRPPLLPAELAELEFGDERHYVRAIAEMAKAHGAKVAFLALPYHRGPDSLQEQKFYDSFGPVWNAGFLAPHAEWYGDYGHLTRKGALVLTDWLADRVAAELKSEGTAK
jgi:hypothetical protein